MRFLNALFNGGATITLTEDGHLALNDKEEHELQAKSSEVLAIGLSTMFMCKWFDINKNTIEKISGNKKRCDYSFYKNNKLIIYESKGRSHKNKIGSAVDDAQKKKSHHPAASEKYSLIAYLPRNGEAVELLVYDPPVTPGEFENDNLYRIAKYYQGASMLAGLYILANGIHQKIINYEKTGKWGRSPIKLDEKVIKLGWSIHAQDTIFWTQIQPVSYFSKVNKKTYYLYFELDNRVVELLIDWNLEELLKKQYEDRLIPKNNISIMHDGTIVHFSDQYIDKYEMKF